MAITNQRFSCALQLPHITLAFRPGNDASVKQVSCDPHSIHILPLVYPDHNIIVCSGAP